MVLFMESGCSLVEGVNILLELYVGKMTRYFKE